MSQVRFKRRIVASRSGNSLSLRVTIPVEIAEALDLKPKDSVRIWLENEKIIIQKEVA